MSMSEGWIVFHNTGVFPVDVDFCDCFDPPPPPRRVQLLWTGWFPASYDRPQTVFTFDVLNAFQKLALQGKTTLYNFYHSLLNLNDNLHLGQTLVPCSTCS